MLVKVLSVYMYQQKKKTKFAKQIIFISLLNHDHAKESNLISQQEILFVYDTMKH